MNSESQRGDILDRWLPEMREHCPEAKVLLVGTKIDLRSSQECMSYKDGVKFGKEIGAVGYMECSALTGEGVAQVVESAVRCATASPEQDNGCVLS